MSAVLDNAFLNVKCQMSNVKYQISNIKYQMSIFIHSIHSDVPVLVPV